MGWISVVEFRDGSPATKLQTDEYPEATAAEGVLKWYDEPSGEAYMFPLDRVRLLVVKERRDDRSH